MQKYVGFILIEICWFLKYKKNETKRSDLDILTATKKNVAISMLKQNMKKMIIAGCQLGNLEQRPKFDDEAAIWSRGHNLEIKDVSINEEVRGKLRANIKTTIKLKHKEKN